MHLVDTHSYPVEQKADPISKLTKYGAYSNEMVYTQEALKNLVHFANVRGKQASKHAIILLILDKLHY